MSGWKKPCPGGQKSMPVCQKTQNRHMKEWEHEATDSAVWWNKNWTFPPKSKMLVLENKRSSSANLQKSALGKALFFSNLNAEWNWECHTCDSDRNGTVRMMWLSIRWMVCVHMLLSLELIFCSLTTTTTYLVYECNLCNKDGNTNLLIFLCRMTERRRMER